MFDFVNYTYSGVLAVLSTLFGLSYPLILSCIEKIDSKFHSTKLSARFFEERDYSIFKYILIANLLIAVLFPFLMDGNLHSRYFIALQCAAMIVMVYSAFRLFRMVMDYYDAGKLQKRIMEDYHAAVKKRNVEAEAKYFTQWSDLTAVLLTSADENLVQSVYEEWYGYVSRKYSDCKGKPLDLDDYFYEAVTRINENLCKGERRPISVNNGNSLLTSLIEGDSIVTEKTFRYLWRNLRLQLYYDREDWIMAYWKMASQKYGMYMQPISTFYVDDNTGENYKKEQVEERNKQREKFEEFHIMLCAMLLQQGKYELLQQMMFFTQSQPPSYPLVPSTLAGLLKVLVYLNEDRLWDVTYFEERYPMPNMHGITEGKILGAANCYIALLFYRLYVLFHPYGTDFTFRTMGLPDNQAELAKYKLDLETLSYWLEKIKNNDEALASIRISDINKIYTDGEGKDMQKPEEIVKAIQHSVDEKLDYLKRNQPNDPEKVDTIEKEVNLKHLMAMKHFTDILWKRFQGGTCYKLYSSANQLYPNTAFQANPDISHGGIEEAVFGGIWHKFCHLFASSFYKERMIADYTIDSVQLFEAFDKLQVDEKCFAFAFGIYMDYYLDRVEKLKKENGRIYSYNGMKIMLLDCPTQLFSRRIYIMAFDDRPCLDFEEPSKEQKEAMELKEFGIYDLWMSIQKVEGHENILPEETLRQLGDDKNLYSMFHAYWTPQLYFKEQYNRICLKVNYKMSDEGTVDAVDKIKPFVLSQTKKNELNGDESLSE